MNDGDKTKAAAEAGYAGRTRFTQLEYEAVLVNASVGIAFTRDRRFFLCNPKFAEMFGWDPDELIGEEGEVIYPSRESFDELARIAPGTGQLQHPTLPAQQLGMVVGDRRTS